MTDDRPPDEHWLTYAEIGNLFGISTEAARQMARRRRWARRIPNEYGAVTRVLVPANQVPDGVHTGDSLGADLSPSLAHPQADGVHTGDDLDINSAPDLLGPPSKGASTGAEWGTREVGTGFERGMATGGGPGDVREYDLGYDRADTLLLVRDTVSLLVAPLSAQLAAANRRVEELQAALSAKDAEHRQERERLTQEIAEQRRMTALLVEKLATRRRWWRWRRWG
jgi:hypothetical protein